MSRSAEIEEVIDKWTESTKFEILARYAFRSRETIRTLFRLMTMLRQSIGEKQHLEDQLKRLTFDVGALDIPPIVINTLPKSGSVYIAHTLGNSLLAHFDGGKLCSGVFPHYEIEAENCEMLRQKRIVCQEHFSATRQGVDTIAQFVDRIVLHLRDPRQAALSFLHHMNKFQQENPGATKTKHVPPDGYMEWSFEKQLDWHIENYLVGTAGWLREWVAELDRLDCPLKIHVTRYEDLLEDHVRFFRDILSFFDIDPAKVPLILPPQTSAMHYRQGTADEWKNVYNPAQKKRAAEILGDDLRQRFGWE